MKKTILFSSALVALAMLASCQKEELIETPSTAGVTEFTATIEQPTKTAIASDGKVTWTAGDEITVTDDASKSAVYVAASSGSSTKFNLKDGQTAVGSGPYTATYGDITKQKYSAVGANCPLTAKTADASTKNLQFSSPYAVLKITAKSSGSEVIKTVVVKYGDKIFTLDCGDGVELTSDGKVFYVAVEPANAALSVTFYTADKKATKNRNSAISLAAKDLFPVTFSLSEWSTTSTFKAVYDTNGEANTLTFYYDDVDHSGERITVYEGSTLFDNSKPNNQKWGYNDKRPDIKSVKIDASVADYTGLTSTAFMFQGMKNATGISGAEYLDVANVTDMSYMFNNFGGGNTNSHTTLNSVPNVSGWNTGNVTNMTAMFESYGNFSDNLAIVPDVSNWNTGNVTDMTYMFQKYGHESQTFNAVPDVSKWNTGNVTNMANMFMEYGHKSTSLNTVPNVSGWNTGKVTNMKQMFYNYGSTSENISCVLDLSGWDLSKITGTNGVNVFNFNPSTFNVKIPAKTGEKANETGKWYYGDGTGYIAPPSGKTFTLPLPAGALAGVFSVSTTKKVLFSKGNLWADGSNALHFESNQYSSVSSWDASHVSHFTWSSTVEAAVGDFFSGDNLFCDESHKVSVDGGDAIYYALSKDEWTYLFDNHTYGWGSVNGKTGYVIAPDGFTGNLESSYADDAALASAGNLVFLPAAGSRDGSSVNNVGDFGIYWSSTALDSDGAYRVFFDSSDVFPGYDGYRDGGYSVRLITESK